MPQEAKDIQLIELKDMIRQLNTTITALTGSIQEKDAVIARLTEVFFGCRPEGMRKGSVQPRRAGTGVLR